VASIEDAVLSIWYSFVSFIPGLITALIWIVIGVVLAIVIGKLLRSITEKFVETPLMGTNVGKSILSLGFRISPVVEFLIEALIIAVAITIAFAYIPIPGEIGSMIYSSIIYLPRIVIGLMILVLGLLFIVVLAKYIASGMRDTLSEPYKGLAVLVEDIVFVGLLAVMISVAMEVMGLAAQNIYPLVLGALVMILGIMVSVEFTKILEAASPGFDKYSHLLQLVLLVSFTTVGLAAMFAQYPVVGAVIKILAVGPAIGTGVVFIILLYTLVKTAREKT